MHVITETKSKELTLKLNTGRTHEQFYEILCKVLMPKNHMLFAENIKYDHGTPFARKSEMSIIEVWFEIILVFN